MYTKYDLIEKTFEDLKMVAIELGIDDEGRTKDQLIYDILDHQVEHPELMKKQSDAAPKKRGRKPKAQNTEINNGGNEPVNNNAEQQQQQQPKKKRNRIAKEDANKTQEIPFPSEEANHEPIKNEGGNKKREKRPRITQEQKENRENKEPVKAQEPVAPKAQEAPKEQREQREPREFKEPEQQREHKEHKDFREGKEPREPKGSQE